MKETADKHKVSIDSLNKKLKKKEIALVRLQGEMTGF